MRLCADELADAYASLSLEDSHGEDLAEGELRNDYQAGSDWLAACLNGSDDVNDDEDDPDWLME